jgi:nitroreductase
VRVHVDDAIRGRRTVKLFTPEAVPAETVAELLDLAVRAPNHHCTEPWRFTVVGPDTLHRLVAATGDEKLLRSTTAVVVAQRVDADPHVAEEDYAAIACAIQNVMLGARARDLASFWRTPKSLGTAAGREVLEVPPDERVVGIVHLGRPRDGFPAAPASTTAPTYTRVLP